MYTHTQQLFSIFFTSNIVDIHERDIVRENQTNRREPTEELGWILVNGCRVHFTGKSTSSVHCTPVHLYIIIHIVKSL